MAALVILDPTNIELSSYIDNVKLGAGTTSESIRSAFGIFDFLGNQRSFAFFIDDAQRTRNEHIADLIAQLLDLAAGKSAVISIQAPMSDPQSENVQIAFRDNPSSSVSYLRDSGVLLWNNSAGTNKYLRAAISDIDLARVVKKVSVFPDASHNQNAFDATPYQLVATLSDDAAIETDANTSISTADAPYGFAFTRSGARSESDLVITWQDASGIRRTAHVTKILHPEKISFHWRRQRDPFQ